VSRAVYLKALKRAVELFGVDGVAAKTEHTPAQVKRWADGADPIPGDVFLQIVDVLLERDGDAHASGNSAQPNQPRGRS
jgi:hypothetical protein